MICRGVKKSILPSHFLLVRIAILLFTCRTFLPCLLITRALCETSHVHEDWAETPRDPQS